MSSSLQPSIDDQLPAECEPQAGRGPAPARSMELDLIPRLLAHARATAELGSSAKAHPAITTAEVDAFVLACLSQNEQRCPAIIKGLIEAGATLERICLELLTPAARILGAKWEEDEVDFVEVTLGTGRMQRVVRDLGRRVAAETPMAADAGQAFLCAMPEEQHSLGLAMVAEFFVADGWGVTVGPPLGVDDVLDEVSAHWFDLVGLSAGIAERVPRIAEVVAAIRAASLNKQLAILVGGRAFVDQPDMVALVGADASAPDAAQGPMVARTLVQARRAALENQTPPSATRSP